MGYKTLEELEDEHKDRIYWKKAELIVKMLRKGAKGDEIMAELRKKGLADNLYPHEIREIYSNG